MEKTILHDNTTVQMINWAEKKDGYSVRDYVVPMMEQSVRSYIANVETTLYVLEIDDIVLPVTVNDKEFDNSYVCSPYTHYISYAKEELWELKKPKLEKILEKGIDGLGFLLKKTNINRVVTVNNWLLSTNLYVPVTAEQIKQLTRYLAGRFPSHTILFRSAAKPLHGSMIDGFDQCGYEAVMSRSIYLFHPDVFHSLNRKQRKDFLQDKRLLGKSVYYIKEAAAEDTHLVLEIKRLYDKLYIDKYSAHNPQFTADFYENALEHGLIAFKLLEREGAVDGVIGYFHRNHVLATPILGYNTTKGTAAGLYRFLSYLIADEVLKKNYTGHFSAGAGHFKRNRGAVQEIEYSYFYNRHLPRRLRLAWRFLKVVMDVIVEPMAKKYKF